MRAAVIFAFLAVVSVSFSQPPQRCEAPKQWSGGLLEVDISKRFRRFAYIAYDLANERFFIEDRVEEGRKEERFRDWFFFDVPEPFGYHMSIDRDLCDKFVIPRNRSFPRIEIPEFAKFVATVNLGVEGQPGESLSVNIWAGDPEDGGFYSGTWTESEHFDGACVPVSDDYVNRTTGLVQWQFFDVRNGVNPGTFTEIPKECL